MKKTATKKPTTPTTLYVVSVRYCWDNDPYVEPRIYAMWQGPVLAFPQMPYVLGAANMPKELFTNRWDYREAWKPLRVFKTRVKAESFARKADGKIRSTCNPFLFGASLADWTHFDEPRLHDWLLDAGLEPPPLTKKKAKFNPRVWRQWYHDNAKTMTALQRAKVWEAMSNVYFHRVEELT